jgi:hypothetical protein
MNSGTASVNHGTGCFQQTAIDGDDDGGDNLNVELHNEQNDAISCSCDHCRPHPLNQHSPTRNCRGIHHHHRCKDHLDDINPSPCPCHERHERRKPYTGLGKMRFQGAYPCMVAISVLVYWTFVSLVPVYNKFFFQETFYPYPVATAGIQLGVVSLLLAVWNAIQQQQQQHEQPQ